MSEVTEQLRASVQEQQKETDALIRSTKEIQKELRTALSSTEAALKEGALLQEKLKKQQRKLKEDRISTQDKEKIAKLLIFIEEKAGPKPETESLIESFDKDTFIESISKTVEGAKKSRGSGSSASSSALKKGHIAL